MNTTTRALIERELGVVQGRHTLALDNIEHLQGRLRSEEAARDECVEQIGALKEDLALTNNATRTTKPPTLTGG